MQPQQEENKMFLSKSDVRASLGANLFEELQTLLAQPLLCSCFSVPELPALDVASTEVFGTCFAAVLLYSILQVILH